MNIFYAYLMDFLIKKIIILYRNISFDLQYLNVGSAIYQNINLSFSCISTLSTFKSTNIEI